MVSPLFKGFDGFDGSDDFNGSAGSESSDDGSEDCFFGCKAARFLSKYSSDDDSL